MNVGIDLEKSIMLVVLTSVAVFANVIMKRYVLSRSIRLSLIKNKMGIYNECYRCENTQTI